MLYKFGDNIINDKTLIYINPKPESGGGFGCVTFKCLSTHEHQHWFGKSHDFWCTISPNKDELIELEKNDDAPFGIRFGLRLKDGSISWWKSLSAFTEDQIDNWDEALVVIRAKKELDELLDKINRSNP